MVQHKEININGKAYPVVFNMQTIIIFEEIANKSFFVVNFNKTTERMALIVSSVMAADKESSITIEEVMAEQDMNALKQINEAFAIIFDMTADFFKIPKVLNPNEELKEEEKKEKENVKN